jgi:hypothetical protein
LGRWRRNSSRRIAVFAWPDLGLFVLDISPVLPGPALLGPACCRRRWRRSKQDIGLTIGDNPFHDIGRCVNDPYHNANIDGPIDIQKPQGDSLGYSGPGVFALIHQLHSRSIAAFLKCKHLRPEF